MKPLISICVAIYKVEPYLDKCIQSILNQTYKNLEIILVDDGSLDNCPTICDKYALQDKRIKVIHKSNGGLVSARKAGVNIATGQYICFVDGDDWIDVSYIETLVQAMLDTKADLVISNFVYSYPDVEFVSKQGNPGLYEQAKLVHLKKHFIYDKTFYKFPLAPSVCNKLFITRQAQVLYRAIPDDLTLGEDLAFSLSYVNQSSSIYIIHADQYYHYTQRQSSMSKDYNPRLFQSVYSLFLFLKPFMQTTLWNTQLIHYVTYMFIGLIQNELRNTAATWHKICQNLQRLNTYPFFDDIRLLSTHGFALYYRLILWGFFHKHYKFLYILYKFKNYMRNITERSKQLYE